VKRRKFIAALGSAAAWPLLARAQQPTVKVRRIGVLLGATPPVQFGMGYLKGFTKGMREFGYVEGKDFVIEWRSAEGAYERFPDLAAELVRLKVDVLVAGTPAAVRPLQQATTTIPVVMAIATDPVGNGLVVSLAHPGGNTTGLASSSDDSAPKQVELLLMAVPKLARVGILTNSGDASSSAVVANVQKAAQSASLLTVSVAASSPTEIDNAFAELAEKHAQAVIVAADALFFAQRQQLAQLALRMGLASMSQRREYADAGGLISYGEGLEEFFRHAASFVDKIFKGANPGDLPVEQPTKFELVINLKTAKALGLEVPPQLLARADEVIE
jgi:putative tryptophan/tyrosine transport system substrate-binding protein